MNYDLLLENVTNPALLFFAKLPMKQAIGTSLLIIFINSSIGFGGDLLAFLPVGKLASMAKSVTSRLGIAGAASGAISTGKELGSQLLGSQQQIDTTKIALDTAFGGAGQLVGDSLTAYLRSRKPVVNSSGELSKQFSDELKRAGINIEEFGQRGKDAIISAYRNLGSSFEKNLDKFDARLSM
jgi:hypothetical protein